MPSAATFELDPRLQADTVPLGDLPLCHVRWMDDARYPWLVLVPRGGWWSELDQLDRAQRGQLMDEIALASQVLRGMEGVDKINVGALGNIVRQLHVHVLARRVGDPAWPGPVWGHGTPVRLDADRTLRQRDAMVRRLLAIAGPAFTPAVQAQSPPGK